MSEKKQSSWKDIVHLFGALLRLRRHMRGGRGLVLASVVTAFICAALEGAGVALLIPILDLLRSDSQPMGTQISVQLSRPASSPEGTQAAYQVQKRAVRQPDGADRGIIRWSGEQ